MADKTLDALWETGTELPVATPDADMEALWNSGTDISAPISIPAETGKGLVRGGGQGITASGFGMEALGSGVASWLNRRASETEASMQAAGQLGPEDSLARVTPSPLEGIGEQTRRMYQQPLGQAFPEDPRLADVTLKPTEILTQDQPARAIAAKLGSSLGESIPSVGAAMGGALVGGAVGGPPGAIAGGGIVGGLMEGAGQYEEAIAKGATPDEASRQAAAMGVMASGLNALPFAAALNKFLPGNKVGLGLRIIAGSLAEGGTETLEGAASQIAALQRIPEGTDEWVSFTKDLGTAIKQESEVFLPSMLLGGGMVAPQAVDATRAKAVSDAPMSDFYGFDPATAPQQPAPEAQPTPAPPVQPQQPATTATPATAPTPAPTAWDFEQPIPSGLTDEQLDEWMSGYLASQEPSVAPEAITTPQEAEVAPTVTQGVPVAPVEAQQAPAVEPVQPTTPSKPRAIADLPTDQQSALRTLRDQNPQGGVTTAQVKAIVGGTRESVKALRDEVNKAIDPDDITAALLNSFRESPESGAATRPITQQDYDEIAAALAYPAESMPSLIGASRTPGGIRRGGGGAQPGLTQMRRPVSSDAPIAPAKELWQMTQEEASQAGWGDNWSSVIRRNANQGKPVPKPILDELARSDSSRAAMDVPASALPDAVIGDTVSRYTHKDGKGLLNNEGLDRSRLSDAENQELIDLMDFGLKQPDQGTKGTFYFTSAGEQKHARMIELLTKASKKGVSRTETRLSSEPSWQSGDGQIAVKDVSQRQGGIADEVQMQGQGRQEEVGLEPTAPPQAAAATEAVATQRQVRSVQFDTYDSAEAALNEARSLRGKGSRAKLKQAKENFDNESSALAKERGFGSQTERNGNVQISHIRDNDFITIFGVNEQNAQRLRDAGWDVSRKNTSYDYIAAKPEYGLKPRGSSDVEYIAKKVVSGEEAIDNALIEAGKKKATPTAPVGASQPAPAQPAATPQAGVAKAKIDQTRLNQLQQELRDAFNATGLAPGEKVDRIEQAQRAYDEEFSRVDKQIRDARMTPQIQYSADTFKAVWAAFDKGESVQVNTRTRSTSITPKNRDAIRWNPRAKQMEVRSGKEWQAVAGETLDDLASKYGVARPEPSDVGAAPEKFSADAIDTPRDAYVAAAKDKDFATAQHRATIDLALSEGQPVPPAVLADYPDLAAKYGQAQASPRTPAAPDASALPAAEVPEARTLAVSFSRPEIGRTRVALGSDSLDVVKTNSGYEVRMPDGRVADTFTKAGEAKAWAQSELEANAWAKEAEVEPLGGAGPQKQTGPSEERSAGRGYFVTEDRYQDSARRFAEAKSRWLSLGIDARMNQRAFNDMVKEIGVQVVYHTERGVRKLTKVKPLIQQYLSASKVSKDDFNRAWGVALKQTEPARNRVKAATRTKRVVEDTAGMKPSRDLLRDAMKYEARGAKAGAKFGRLDAAADVKDAITLAQSVLPKSEAAKVVKVAQLALRSAGSQRQTIMDRVIKSVNRYAERMEHSAAVNEAKTVIAQARKGKFLDKNKEKIDALLKDIAVSKPRPSTVRRANSTLDAAASSPDLAQEIPQRLQDKAQGTLDTDLGLSTQTMDLLRSMPADKVQDLVQNLKSIMRQDERLKEIKKQRKNKTMAQALKDSAQEVRDRNAKRLAAMEKMTPEEKAISRRLDSTLQSNIDWTKSTDNIVLDIAGEDSVANAILVEAFDEGDAKFYQLQAQAKDHMARAMEGISEQELKEMGWANSGFEGATRLGQATRIAKPPKLHKIQLPNGKSLVMTSGQRISFALMWNDPDTRYNMLKNKSEGVVLTDDKQNTRHSIDRDSAKAILSSVTPTEQRIADVMSQYLNGPNREALAAWWQDRHGFNPFDNDKYWPRRRLTADKEMEDIVQYEGGLPEHYGIFQMRSGSTAPLMVGDAFSEFFAHINKTATLISKANALNDAIRLLDRDSEFSKAVKASVKNGEDKLEQLRTRSKNDVVSKVRDRNPGDAEVRKLMSNFGRAKLAANVPVIASQSLSALSMQADIGVKHVAKAYLEARTNRMSKYEQDIRKFAPTLAVMFDGGGARIIFPESSSAAVQDFYGIKSPLEALWTPMKRENEVAVVTAWLAAKREGAEMGLEGDALNEYAGPRATKVYTRSQPSTDMTSQSGVKLSARDNIFWAIAAMFRSQTDKMYQQTIRAITLRKHGEISTAKMVKDISVAVLLQSVIFNATKMLWKGAKASAAAGLGLGVAGAVSGDDEDKMAALIAKSAVDFVGMIPLFGNIAEPIAEVVSKAARGIRIMPWDTINQNPIASTLTDATKAVQDLVEGDYGKAAARGADVAGTVAGLPVGEVLRAFK